MRNKDDRRFASVHINIYGYDRVRRNVFVTVRSQLELWSSISTGFDIWSSSLAH